MKNYLNNVNLLFAIFTEECNSKCIMCNYWEAKDEKPIENERILKSIDFLAQRNLKKVIFTGGEALLRSSDLFYVAQGIKSKYPALELRLLTNGILINKYIDEIDELFDIVAVSFDSANAINYARIRGVNAFELVINNIKLLRNCKKQKEIRLRTVVQKSNYKEIMEIINLAADLKVDKLSFIPLDTFIADSFGKKRNLSLYKSLVLDETDTQEFERIVHEIISNYIPDSKYDLLVQRGKDLSNILSYYKNGLKGYAQRCNGFENSLVFKTNGDISTCFFMDNIGNIREQTLEEIVNSTKFDSLMSEIISGHRKECERCTCPIYV